MSKLTVIMPAAGKGTRLNLPYPKEILRLDKEQALIDYSFDFFRDYGRKDVEFVIVVNEQKTEIIEYLAKYKDRYNISFVYQKMFVLQNRVFVPGVDLLLTIFNARGSVSLIHP